MITLEQIKAARALLGWSQKDLAAHADLSLTGIAKIENGSNTPTMTTMEKILRAFEKQRIEFLQDGVRKTSDIVTIREGDDCYLKLLDDALLDLQNSKDEILFWAADERRSSDIVIAKTRTLRQSGIKMRFLIKENDSHMMGKPEEYRWLAKNLFADGDVKIIYGNKISYFVSWHNQDKIITIKDEHISKEHRRLFNHFWKTGKEPKKSSAKISYEEAQHAS